MNLEGKKVRYKVGKGSAVGTVMQDRGDTVSILTKRGVSLIRKTASIVSEEHSSFGGAEKSTHQIPPETGFHSLSGF